MSKALLHGLPVLIVIALIVLVYRRSGNQRPVYRLSQPWTHEPILWSAIDEPIPAVRHAAHDSAGGHGSAAAHGSVVAHETVVGGGASGRW